MPDPARRRLLAPTVIRTDGAGRCWLMSRREGGWASFGYCYESLEALLAEWDVRVTGEGRDGWSRYWECE
jgi:hypothetical protein